MRLAFEMQTGDPMKTIAATTLTLVAVLLISLPTSRGAQQQPDRATVSAREKELRALEAAMMAGAAEKGADGYMSFYAEDAVELPDGAPALLGKETIGKTMTFLNDKNNRLTWSPVHVDVSESGDLGYTFGNYEFRSIGKDGKPAVEHGKYTTIWKKQKDGRWK